MAKKGPFFPLLMFPQVEGRPRKVPPKVGNFAQATVPVLEPKPEHYAKMGGSEVARGSLVCLLKQRSPVWHREVSADKTPPIKLPAAV